MTLSETIRARRDELGLTRWELATRLRDIAEKRGVECSAQENLISYWEGGNYSPNARMMPLLALALECSTDFLYGLHSLPNAAGVALSRPQRPKKRVRR